MLQPLGGRTWLPILASLLIGYVRVDKHQPLQLPRLNPSNKNHKHEQMTSIYITGWVYKKNIYDIRVGKEFILQLEYKMYTQYHTAQEMIPVVI